MAKPENLNYSKIQSVFEKYIEKDKIIPFLEELSTLEGIRGKKTHEYTMTILKRVAYTFLSHRK